jgi:hypothetical protein
MKFAATVTKHNGQKYVFSQHRTLELAQKQCRLLQNKRQNTPEAKHYHKWMLEGKAHHYGETYTAEAL